MGTIKLKVEINPITTESKITKTEVFKSSVGYKKGWAFSVCWNGRPYPNLVSALYKTKKETAEKLKVYLDMNKVLSKHAVVLAKSGSGKSYCTAILLEELLLKRIPIVVIDPHGEYASLKYPNPKDKENMLRFGVEAQGFLKQIQEFSPDLQINSDAKPLKLSNRNLTSAELIHLLPTKISSSQLGLIYGALKNLGGRVDFNEMMIELEASEDNPSKWSLIHIFEYVKKLKLLTSFHDDHAHCLPSNFKIDGINNVVITSHHPGIFIFYTTLHNLKTFVGESLAKSG